MFSTELTRREYNALSAQLGGNWLYWSGVVTTVYDENLKAYDTSGPLFGNFLSQGEGVPEMPHEYHLGTQGNSYMLPRRTVLLQLAEGYGQFIVVTDDAIDLGDLILQAAELPLREWKELKRAA